MGAQFADRVDPQLRDGLQIYEALGFAEQSITGEVITDLRTRATSIMASLQPDLGDDVTLEKVTVPGMDGDPDVALRIYRRVGAVNAPGLYWIHSGGMMLGSAAQDDIACVAVTRAMGCTIVSVDYRLAPEHPHPAPVNDCYAGLRWMSTNAVALGMDADRIAISGASAGGGLAAGVTLMARDRGGPALVGQLLIAPMLDDRALTASTREFEDVLTWSAGHNRSGWSALLGDRVGTDDVSPYAAPARAEDVSGLPPAIIQVGALEVFRDEDITYATRLLQAGVPVELHVFPGAYHGSETMAPTADSSRRAVDARRAALARWFAQAPDG